MRFTFADYILSESSGSKKLVFSFGRFQPPTIGHKLLIDKVVSQAKSLRADHLIYASKTQDKKSNPLNVNIKVKYLRKMFPGVNFEPANEEIRTFIEALKNFYKKGYKEVYMVAGSDRLADYQRIFDKYNGGEDFSFEKLKVISAGERDPDAEGASGMSGTKMRQAAFAGNFELFRQGIPSSLSDSDAKKLMDDIRRIKPLKEFTDFSLQEILSEGVNDKAIFKAVFLAGGPGSGKDYVLKRTLEGHGLVEINSDTAFEYLLDKYNLDKKMPESEEAQRNAIRAKAKSIKELKERLAIQGRNGLIINGTGEDPEKIASLKLKLEGLGYDTQMLFVHTKNEVSKQRNIERGEAGGRTVPEEIRLEKWENAQTNRKNFREMFEQGYVEFDNSEDLRKADPEVVAQKDAELLDLFKRFRKFTETAPSSEDANNWIKDQKLINKSLVDNPPPPQQTAIEPTEPTQMVQQPQAAQPAPAQQSVVDAGQNIMQQASQMGLVYFGFGRFGKDGQVTHIEQDGKLVPFKSVNEQFKAFKSPREIADKHKVSLTSIMKQLKQGIKVEREHTSHEKMARKIALQHLDEFPDYYSRLKKIEKPLKEGYEFSGSDAMQLLTLGKSNDFSDYSINLNNEEKINVHETDSISKEYQSTQTRNVRDFTGFTSRTGEAGRGSKGSEKREKAHNQESRKKEKDSRLESYDSPSAESPGIFGHSKDDWKRGKTSVTELTGDVELTTISFQKDDERKKSGLEPFITFKSKNVVG